MATVPRALQEPPVFSLMLGGPVYQIFQRAHLAGPALVKVIVAATVVPVLPLLLTIMPLEELLHRLVKIVS